MAGKITHSWNGTVLTVTSDSGTSSADLKGEKGDKGSRGPQGRAGVIVNADGSVDMSGYATETYVDEQIANVSSGGTIDLSNYATKQYVDEKVAESGGSGSVDLSNYYTKAQTDSAISTAVAAIEIPTTDLSNYYTKTETDAKIAEAQLGGEVDLSAYALKSEIPSLEGYATETWVNSKGYLTEHQSIKTINGQSLIGTGDITINGSGETVDLSNYYTKTEIDNKGYQTADQVNALIQAALDAIGVAEGGSY